MRSISTALLILIFLLFGAMLYRACGQDLPDTIINRKLHPPFKYKNCKILNSTNCSIEYNACNVKLINCHNVRIIGNTIGQVTDNLTVVKDTNNIYFYKNAWINRNEKRYVNQ